MTREEREKREHRERLRATFDQAAGLYGRARPGYPPALFDDLAAVARLNLARFPTIEVLTAAFEDRPPPSEPFDLVGPDDVPGTGRLGLGCRRWVSTSAAAAGTRRTIGRSRALRSAAAGPARARRPG
jgi:hypothetical protein